MASWKDEILKFIELNPDNSHNENMKQDLEDKDVFVMLSIKKDKINTDRAFVWVS